MTWRVHLHHLTESPNQLILTLFDSSSCRYADCTTPNCCHGKVPCVCGSSSQRSIVLPSIEPTAYLPITRHMPVRPAYSHRCARTQLLRQPQLQQRYRNVSYSTHQFSCLIQTRCRWSNDCNKQYTLTWNYPFSFSSFSLSHAHLCSLLQSTIGFGGMLRILACVTY